MGPSVSWIACFWPGFGWKPVASQRSSIEKPGWVMLRFLASAMDKEKGVVPPRGACFPGISLSISRHRLKAGYVWSV